MSVSETMHEMGPQTDPVREALRRMLAEFGDDHYYTCPADSGRGPCNCYGGRLVAEALAVLANTADQKTVTNGEPT